MKKWILLALFLLLGCSGRAPIEYQQPIVSVNSEIIQNVYEAEKPIHTASTAALAPSQETAAPPPDEKPAEKREFRIPVLNYHSIGIDPGNPAVISPKKFEEQMAFLKNGNYTTLRIQDFKDIWEGKKKAPAKAVLLTFDDGYTDNYEIAMPILQKYGFHATLFMITGWTEKDGYLNWDQAKEMQQAGWDILPHSMNHPHLPRLSPEKQKFEIVESRKLIEEKLGGTADVFCYPYGEYNKETLKILRDHQFQYAFTIEQGYADPSQNPLLIKRWFINGEEGMASFKKKLQ